MSVSPVAPFQRKVGGAASKFDRLGRRKIWSLSMKILSAGAVAVVLTPLFLVIYQAILLGGSVISFSFFTSLPPLACSPQPGVSCAAGGVANGIQGTLIVVGLASLIAIPIAVVAAIYLVEYDVRRSGSIVSFAADVLTGVPSIIVGMFIYAILVIYYPQIVFSVVAGSFALAVLMIPIITRTSEEALRTVPHSMREAALALGIPKWRTSLQITLVAALPGVVTGCLFGVMRAAGETAALLLTLFGSQRFFQGLTEPAAALPLQIYVYGTSPYLNWQQLAWGATLVLIGLVLVLSVISRLVLDRLARRMRGG